MKDYQALPTGFDGVLRTADGANIPDDDANVDWQTYQAWLDAGNTPDPAPAPPTPPVDPDSAEYQFALRAAWVQAWLDTTAQENNYIDAVNCISYMASTNAIYAADAKALCDWRSDLWPALNAMPANWPADPTQWPLWDSIQPLLPQPAAYGWQQHDPVNSAPQFLAFEKRARI
jgi:hypothetical protein